MLRSNSYRLKIIQTIILLLISIYPFSTTTQAQNRAGIQVKGIESTPMKYAWAGGLNSVQFGSIDINRDGLKDIFAFDRNGNRKLCFVNNGVYNAIDFSYQPQYSKLFPDLSDWAVFADYDGDGRTDIFTYSPGWAGMLVYRNVSEDLLKFELVISPFLKTYQESGYVNLLVTDVDYPGIADLDGDGDLDILAFWGLGTFVNYNRNMSMEKYGNADSLDFQLEEYCWGFFAESEESNQIFLDTCFLSRNPISIPKDKERHRGSTFLILDLDNDTVLDVLLGDVDYPELFALTNGGTQQDALITDVDTTFPQSSTELSIFDFPVTAYIDVNNDTKKDLLVSPFDPRLETAQNKKSVWLYQNTGSSENPFFVIETKDFLQSQMIDRGSGAYPVLYDWDGDGLLDLFVGNYGFYQSSFYNNLNLVSVYRSRIGYFKNTGTAQNPAFQLWDDDFANLSELNKVALVPAFSDLDGDGKTDLIVGDSTGNLIYVKNLGGEDFEVITENYQNINDGFFNVPQLFDLDKDGLDDLILGEQNGNINYYRNEGSSENPNFTFVTDSLGKINVTDYNTSWFGFSTPSFFRLEDGETRLVVGSESGEVFYYTNIDSNLDGAFSESDLLDELLDTTGISFDRGIRTGAFVGDLNNDSKAEMIVGNYSGGLEFFNGNAEVLPGFVDFSETRNKLQLFPNPAQSSATLIFPDLQTKIKIIVTDLNGRTVLTKTPTEKSLRTYSIDVSSLKNGIYFMSVKSETSVFSAKLMIQR